jgi:hypothetical protein
LHKFEFEILIEGEERGNKSAILGRKRSNSTQNREPTVRSKSNLKLPPSRIFQKTSKNPSLPALSDSTIHFKDSHTFIDSLKQPSSRIFQKLQGPPPYLHFSTYI